MDNIEKEKLVKKSLFYSIVEGSFWSMMFGFGERYLSAFAVFLKASNFQLGLLTSLPLLIGSLSQFLSLRFIEVYKKRKRFVISAAVIQAFSFLLILLVFYLGKYRVYYLILFAVIYMTSGMIASPAWNSWMGDLVDSDERGRYFSRRNKILGAFILLSTILGGIVLELFKNGAERQYLGFLAIFIAALISRLASAFFLSRKFEPEMVEVKEADKFTFWEFLKQARFRNYGLFVMFLTSMNFAVYVSAPFFISYMFYDLNFSYLQYMVLLAVAFIVKYFSFPVWGRLADEYGNKKILVITGFFLPLIPLFWVFSTNYYWLVFVEMASGGIWSGFELSSFNFVFDSTTPQKRARCVSYFNALNGVLIFLGTMLGSLLLRYNHLFWSKYYLVFIVSGVLRCIVAVAYLPKLKEARKVSSINYQNLFLKATDMMLSTSFNHLTYLFSYPKRFRKKSEYVAAEKLNKPAGKLK